ILILTVISLASWGTINKTLAMMGSKPQWSSQKTARLWTIASSWTQAELEYAKQLGFGVACGTPPCTIWVRTPAPGTVEVSTDGCATWSSSNPPFSEGPALHEVLIALVLMGLVSLAVFAAFKAGDTAWATSVQFVAEQQNARMLLNTVSRAVRMVGYQYTGGNPPVIDGQSSSLAFYADI